MGRLVTHTGTFEHAGIDLAFTRWEALRVEGVAPGVAGGRLASRLPRALSRKAAGKLEQGYDPCSNCAPLVLLHGFAQSSATWAEVAPLLAQTEGAGAVYALELVGHGESTRPNDAAHYGMDAVCACVRDFCAWVARREGALPVLTGYSMGGRVALECLVRFGEPSSVQDASALPVRALVLESAGLGPVDSAAREAFRTRNEDWAQRVRAEGVSAFMDYWESLPLFASQRNLLPAARAALREARERNDAEALARTFEGTGQHHQHVQAETLSALAGAPGLSVLYLAGDLDAKYAQVADEVRRACPHAFVRMIPGAGHSVHLEQPAAFLQELQRFLQAQ